MTLKHLNDIHFLQGIRELITKNQLSYNECAVFVSACPLGMQKSNEEFSKCKFEEGDTKS